MASFIGPYLWMVWWVIGFCLFCYWVILDARARGSDAATWWGVFSMVFTPVLLFYLFYRRRIGERGPIDSVEERFAGTVSIAFAVSFLPVTIAPPDPYTQILYSAVLGIVGLPIGYLLIWRGKYNTIVGRPA